MPKVKQNVKKRKASLERLELSTHCLEGFGAKKLILLDCDYLKFTKQNQDLLYMSLLCPIQGNKPRSSKFHQHLDY